MGKSTVLVTLISLLLGHVAALTNKAVAQQIQPPAQCHPNPSATRDMATVRNRDDVKNLPAPLKDRLATLAGRLHSILPVQAFAEADKPSQLFQYYRWTHTALSRTFSQAEFRASMTQPYTRFRQSSLISNN
jgi:hypothetical protein